MHAEKYLIVYFQNQQSPVAGENFGKNYCVRKKGYHEILTLQTDRYEQWKTIIWFSK